MSSRASPGLDIRQRTEKLKRQEQRFWTSVREGSIADPVRSYVETLLTDQMALAAAKGDRLPNLNELTGGRCETLVLLVGFSHEPLLQSIAAFRPCEVVPVLNQSYGTKTAAAMREVVEDGVQHLRHQGLLSECRVRPCAPLTADDPATVFRFLLRELGPEVDDRSTVIDISGGKKSMVAGAFFFAAYANVAISYVDFDDYDVEWRRPFGCTCRIGFITNPYREFRLRDWAAVQRAYEQYRFSAARESLESLLASMRAGEYFEELQIEAAQRLASVLEVYEAWDNGDHRAALAKLRSLPDALSAELAGKLPDAIEALGDCWPHPGGDGEVAAHLLAEHRALELGEQGAENTFYRRMPLLVAYVRDELQKIRRLLEIKEDYRAALVRADGVVEVMLVARLFVLWKEETLVVEVDQQPDHVLAGEGERDPGIQATHGPKTVAMADLLPEQRRELYEELTAYPGDPGDMIKVLRWKPSKGRDRVARRLVLKRPLAAFRGGSPGAVGGERNAGHGGDETTPTPRVAVRATREELRDFWSGSGLKDVNELRKLRNKATHTYLPIPRSVSEAAWRMAEACWRDFVEVWLPRAEPDFSLMPGIWEGMKWPELCSACGVDFLPPYRQEGS